MNHQRWLSQNFFVFFVTWGIFLPYWAGWLVEAKHLSVSQVSVIMGFGLLARAASTMFAFPFASKYLSNMRLVMWLIIFSVLSLLMYFPSNSFWMLFIVTFLFSLFYPTLLPAIESSAAPLLQYGVHYGKSRSYGSIGYVISVLIISMLTGKFGEQAILWSMLIGLMIMLVVQLLPAPAILALKPTIEDRKSSFSMRQLFATKSFIFVMLVVILLQGAHASYYNYAYIYLQDLKVNPYYIGIVLNVAVLFEILYFMKSDRLFVKWRASSLLLLAAVGSTVRWILIYLFPNILVFVISQSLHALSFGVAHYAFIMYITKNLPKQQIPNAQGIYSAIGMSLSAAILTLLGGYLYEISPGLAFLGMVICTIPAIVVLIGTRDKYQY